MQKSKIRGQISETDFIRNIYLTVKIRLHFTILDIAITILA